MTDSTEEVHVAWGVSRAESVRDALHKQGQRARVIALSGTLSVGPIDLPDLGARQAWAAANLYDDDPHREWHELEAPWMEAISQDVHPVYWVCLSDAAEHASFLAFASRMGERPFDIVDVTGLDFTTAGGISPIWSLGLLRPEEIIASGVYAGRRPITPAESEAASATWSQLQRENAPLRVVRDGRLVSAPLTHFDPVLTGQAKPDWELAVKLIGRALNHLNFEVDPPGQGVGAEFLFARVLALGEAGDLDVRSAGSGMREFDVRLPATCSPPRVA